MAIAGSTHALYVTHIKTILERVSGIGKVYGRPRELQDVDEIEEAFTSGTPAIINGGIIQRERITTLRQGAPSGTEFRFPVYVIRYWYELSEEKDSDDTFQALLNRILDAFLETRIKATPTSTVFFEDMTDITVRLITVQKLSHVYAHFFEAALTFKERIQCIVYSL